MPESGVVGFFQMADPPHACDPLRNKPTAAGEPWVALVARSPEIPDCHFVRKAANALAAGAAGMVVFDIVQARPEE